MILLLQSFTHSIELVLSGTYGHPAGTGQLVGSQMSIGLVVKKFWNKTLQLNNMFQQLGSENKSIHRTVHKLEAINSELQLQSSKTTNKFNSVKNPPSNSSTETKIISRGNSNQVPSNNSSITIAKDIRTLATQTIETAFVPCEACACVQISLKNVADMITDICKSQNLPSAIEKHRTLETAHTMAAVDVSRWTAHQGKDITRIKQHLRDLVNRIDLGKSDLSNLKLECQQLKSDLDATSKSLDKERDLHGNDLRRHSAKLKDVERQHAESILIVHRSLEEMKKGRNEAVEELLVLKRELQKQSEALCQLEDLKMRLKEEVREGTSNKSSVARLESHVQELSHQLQATNQELQETSGHLGREQARNRSIDKHGQLVQHKHDALARRIDDLDQDCCNLRDSLADAEEAREQLTERLKESQQEVEASREELQQNKDLLRSVSDEKSFLESSIRDLQTMIVTLEAQVVDAQDRERILVQYPDMNPGILPQGPVPTGEGDNPSDMRQQVQSNNIRIQILEEQNNLLRKNIGRMLDVQDESQRGPKVSGPAVPLWQPAKNYPANTRSKTMQQSVDVPHQGYTQSRGNKPESTVHAINEDPCGYSIPTKPPQRQSKDTIRKKQANGSKPPLKNRQGWIHGKQENNSARSADLYSPMKTFICKSCDKMYTSEQDLEIHQSYCYG